MNTQAQFLADALQGFFSNPQAGWFTPLSVALQGLTAAQAAQIPAERFNSVWGVVNHVRFWQEYMFTRLQGKQVKRVVLAGAHGWPPVPENPHQEDWAADQESMFTVNQELAKYVASLSDAVLFQPVSTGKPTTYQVIQGLISHNSYHTCEVISIRHMLGLWLERT